MLSKKNRINSELFEDIRTTGKRVTNPYFSMVFVPNNEKKAQFGIVVSKKKLPRAVDRNSQKRRFYGILSDYLGAFEGISALFFIQTKSFSASDEEINAQIKGVLSQF